MPWLRLWTDILDSEKVAELEDELYRGWTMLLLGAKRYDQDGILPPIKRLAYWLRRSEGTITDWIERLEVLGMIDSTPDGHVMHDWDKWQPDKDPTGAKRQRDWRAANKKSPSALPKNRADTEQSRAEEKRDRSRDKAVTGHVTGHVTSPPSNDLPTGITHEFIAEAGKRAAEAMQDISWALWTATQLRMGTPPGDLEIAIERCINTGKRTQHYAAGIVRSLASERAKKGKSA